MAPPGVDDGSGGMPLDMMGPDETDRVAEFLTDCYSVGPVAELALHQVAGGTQTMIRDWSGAELAEATDAQGLAGEVVTVAQEDCEHAGLPVGRYVVSAMRQPGGPPIRRCFFTVAGPAFNGATFADEYGGESIAQQQMRHNESIMRLALGGQSAVARTLMLMNHELMADARDAKRAQLAAVELREQMLDRQQERGLALRREQLSVDRRERMYRIVESYVPHLAQRIGLPTSTAMQQLSAGGGNGVAGNGSNTKPTTVADPELVTLANDVTRIVLGLLAATDDAGIAPLLSRLPADDARLVSAVRTSVIDRAEHGGGRAGTYEERAQLARFADLVCTMIAGNVVDAFTVGALLGRLDDADQAKVLRLREALLRLRAANAASAAPTSGTTATTSTQTPANGAGTAGPAS